MGEILGLGTTHYPPLALKAEYLLAPLRMTLSPPKVAARYKDRAMAPGKLKVPLSRPSQGRPGHSRYQHTPEPPPSPAPPFSPPSAHLRANPPAASSPPPRP